MGGRDGGIEIQEEAGSRGIGGTQFIGDIVYSFLEDLIKTRW